MRHYGSLLASLAYVSFILPGAHAQFVVESLSFGHLPNLSPNGRDIPGWKVTGEGHEPQLLSDRVLLTPPAPGNRRGALWTESTLDYPEWKVDLEFRATGPERGSGNLQIWFTKDTQPASGLSSIYTVDRFDGLALVVDQYGGSGGALRGFLSDGSMSYKGHHNVDGLSFGHCAFPYRNRGAMSKLTFAQKTDGFEVLVDEQTCFRSDQINLPSGYYFGVSAASAETPDAFEIARFVTSTTNSITREEPRRESEPPPPPPTPENEGIPQSESGNEAMTPPPNPFHNQANRVLGRSGQTTDAQFGELLNRLQAATHSINNVYNEIVSLDKRFEDRHAEIDNKLNEAKIPDQQLASVLARLSSIEATVNRIQGDVEGRDYKEHLANLQTALKNTQTDLLDNLPRTLSTIVSGSAPRMGFFLTVIISFQLALVGAYIWYKRRRANSPKKYL